MAIERTARRRFRADSGTCRMFVVPKRPALLRLHNRRRYWTDEPGGAERPRIHLTRILILNGATSNEGILSPQPNKSTACSNASRFCFWVGLRQGYARFSFEASVATGRGSAEPLWD